MPPRKPRKKPGPKADATDFDKLNQVQLAKLHDVSARSITNWAAAGLPRNDDGSFSAAQSIAWRLRREVNDGLSLNAERAKLAKVQRELTQLKLDQANGDLAPLPIISREFGKLLSEVRDNALAIPSRYAPELEGQDEHQRRATLEKAVYELLDNCSGWSPSAAASGAASPEAVPDEVAPLNATAS